MVDPYGLVCKAGIWYLVADSGGEPRLFRVSRVVSAVADEAPAQRRDGVDLAALWASLRREVEDRPAPLEVRVRVRREWLDMFGRICAAHLTGPLEPVPGPTGEWTEVRLRFAAVKAARTLLSFGANADVISPPEVRRPGRGGGGGRRVLPIECPFGREVDRRAIPVARHALTIK